MAERSSVHPRDGARVSRRRLLGQSAGASAAGLLGLTAIAPAAERASTAKPERKGRIKQSIAYWCYEKQWGLKKTCEVARQLGCGSVELVAVEDWPVLKSYGLVCALANS